MKTDPTTNGSACAARPGAAVPDLVREIARAAAFPDRRISDSLLSEMQLCGIPNDLLIDAYIPEAARLLGAEWCENGRSFAEVTIGSARLQAWLKSLASTEEAVFRADTPEVLLILPKGAQHSLGTLVAAEQFRRLGALVRLSLGEDAATVAARTRIHRFDMVALSAPDTESLEFLAQLANIVRMGIAPHPPVVVGGAALACAGDIGAKVGADFATNDPGEALALCGLMTSDRDKAARPRASLNTEALLARAQWI